MRANVTIRQYEDRDAAAFEAINRGWLEEFDLYEPADEAALVDPRREILAGGGVIFVALDGGDVVGTAALVRDDPSTFELAKIAVRPSHRGAGIGRKLTERCIAAARESGAHSLYLLSNSRLEAGLRLYETLGFRATPVGESKYQTADVRMELPLSS